MITIKINGKDWEVHPETNIMDLLGRFKIHPKICAVEINSEIMPRSEYKNKVIKAGDQIEIIRLMAGG
ncbi:sulfur carrier protein ThiS [Candidatus Saganbacteria bacterium]|nr:sulfur carrier protein ThiS [Candidatus Saganbacteria bacterium]